MNKLAASLPLLLTLCVAQTRPTDNPPTAPLTFDDKGAKVGEQLPDICLRSIDNEPTPLRSELHGCTLLVTSSFTCPKSRENFPGLAALQAHYKDRLHVIIIYVLEAHPAGDPSPYRNGKEDVTAQNQQDGILRRQPATLEKRIALAKEFSARFASKIPILVDPMSNLAWKSLGAGPNMAVLVDYRGEVLARQGWFNPKTLAADIDKSLEPAASRKDGYESDADKQLGEQLAREKLDGWEFSKLARDDHLPQLERALRLQPALATFVVSYMGKGDEGGRTLLQYAAEENQLAAAKLLLAKGADPEQFTAHRPSALHLAAAGGFDALLKEFLPQVKHVDLRQDGGPTPLQEALFNCHAATADMLVKAGARENFFTQVARGNASEVAAAIAADSSIASRLDGHDRSPLDYAAAAGQIDVARLLLHADASASPPAGSREKAPLEQAIRKHHPDLVKLLLDSGADVGHAIYPAGTLLHLAAKTGDPAAAQLLLKAGAKLTSQDMQGYTPLHAACAAGQAAVIPVLLDAGASVNEISGVENLPCGPMEPESQLVTPLNLAAGSGNAEAVKVLLDRHADITLTDADYQTALHSAVNSYGVKPAQILQVLQILLDAHLPINAEDDQGQTALDLARQRELASVARFLVEKGGKVGSNTHRKKKPPPKGVGSLLP